MCLSNANFWDWLIRSDAGLLFRVGLGVVVFVGLAAWHVRRGDRSRWKEYAFLAGCVGAALAYGVINDQITVTLSSEYIHWHAQELNLTWQAAGPDDPAIRLTALEMGLKATWTVGLILGAAVLLANNPRKNGRERLGYRTLVRLVGLAVLCAAAFGTAFGVVGGLGWLSSVDLAMAGIRQPERFMAVYGVHLGGYVGGLAGGVVAVAYILIVRRKMAPGLSPCGRNEDQ